ncbi:ATP-binding cassette domain-containing protein [Methylobacterium terricola]|uniref:ATP-binding cassette domain-containing protein n=1 Tax=Methylobacterium terricola TaxID=2583531 RepID=UPI002482B36B|nr:ATP-binding cassette domain-containing protein [Methylobacterium terricola]
MTRGARLTPDSRSAIARGATDFTVDGRPLRARDGIDLSVAPGEFVTIVGASGCGTSTLLRIVAGLDPAHDGAVRHDGRPIWRCAASCSLSPPPRSRPAPPLARRPTPPRRRTDPFGCARQARTGAGADAPDALASTRRCQGARV